METSRLNLYYNILKMSFRVLEVHRNTSFSLKTEEQCFSLDGQTQMFGNTDVGTHHFLPIGSFNQDVAFIDSSGSDHTPPFRKTTTGIRLV